MSTYIYEIVVYLCEAIIFGIYYVSIFNTKYRKDLTVITLCQIVVLLTFITPEFSVIRIAAIYIMEFLYICIFFTDSFRDKVFKYFIQMGIMGFSSLISLSIYNLFTESQISLIKGCSTESATYCLLYLIISSVFTSIVLQLVKKKTDFEIFWVCGTLLFFGIGECGMVSAAAMKENGIIDPEKNPVFVFAAVMMVFANLSVGVFAPYILSKLSEAKTLDYGNEISRMEYKFYEKAVENEHNIRTLKHEISNQIQTIYCLLQSGENQKGLVFVNNLRNQYSHVDKLMYCNNPVVNIIISNKKAKAEELNIETSIKVNDDLDKLNIDDYDLSTIICNMLDNAIQGCVSSGQTNPKLNIEILSKNKHLVIRIVNSCKTSMYFEETDKIETTKSSSNNHGIGMALISRTVKKYKGDFVVSAQNGMFTAIAVMSLK